MMVGEKESFSARQRWGFASIVVSLACTALVVCGIVLVAVPGMSDGRMGALARVVGWIAIVSFGGLLVLFLYMLVVRAEVISIDDDGIRSPRSGWAFGWDEVSDVVVATQGSGLLRVDNLAVNGNPFEYGWLPPQVGMVNARMVRGLPGAAGRFIVAWGPGTAPNCGQALAAVRRYAPAHVRVSDFR